MTKALSTKIIASVATKRAEDARASKIEKLTLVPRQNPAAGMSREDLNKALAYFYNNGGPIMEEKDGVIMCAAVKTQRPKDRARVQSTPDTISVLTSKGTKNLSIDYLNEKLAYFYSHGGPIMDI